MALEPKTLRVKHAYEQVSSEIEAQILSGGLKPGDRLPSEQEMAAMFSVNRSTVREGIRRLESDGFVRRVSPRRLEVSLPRMNELASRQSRALRMLEVSFEELWSVAIATEPLAAEQAALHARKADIAALEKIQRALETATDSGSDTVRLDTEFHSRIAAASQNRVLQMCREPVGHLLYAGMEKLVDRLPQATGRQLVAHQRIIDAIRDGDASMARDWMHKHIEDFRRGFVLAGLPLDKPIAAHFAKPKG